MTKVIHRPEPPIEPAGVQRIHKNSLLQNREVSARLFEKALQRAETQRSHDANKQERSHGLRRQIDSQNNQQSAVRSDIAAGAENSDAITQSTIRNVAAQTSDACDATMTAESLFDEDVATTESDDNNSDDTSALLSAYTPDFGFADVSRHSEHHGADNFGRPDTDSGDAMAESFGRAGNDLAAAQLLANTETRQLDGLSSLDELINQSGALDASNEWCFTFDEHHPVAELRLSLESDGRWQVGISTDAREALTESALIQELRQRLETRGVRTSTVTISAIAGHSEDTKE